MKDLGANNENLKGLVVGIVALDWLLHLDGWDSTNNALIYGCYSTIWVGVVAEFQPPNLGFYQYKILLIRFRQFKISNFNRFPLNQQNDSK